ncbi:hypothetical protein QBC46DRAFT_412708 [Diplogelasinospora grovesii]|uniref:Uncharacterized protein n=1 Tax=Diplogelasinospora grovesii TaxID=303347 RepID=A0AAN6MZU9_9PEZI|nr:hypothetical protein QBC46DRAFT_412708 [Diplogelasinospora grovesii]
MRQRLAMLQLANRDSLRFAYATALCKLDDAANRSNNSPRHTHTTVRSRPDDVAKSNGSSNSPIRPDVFTKSNGSSDSPIRIGSSLNVVAKSNGSSDSPIRTGFSLDVVTKSNGSSDSPVRTGSSLDVVAKSNGSSDSPIRTGSRPDDVANAEHPRQSTTGLQPGHTLIRTRVACTSSGANVDSLRDMRAVPSKPEDGGSLNTYKVARELLR